jgi:hypothetical protein
MRRLAPFAALVLVLTGALVPVELALPGQRVRATAAYLIALGVVGLVLSLAQLPRTRGGGRSPFEDALAESPPAAERIRPLARMEHDVAQGLRNPVDFHRRLRPILREIAAQRLAGHGVELDGPAEGIRRLLGDEAWDLLRPDRPRPDEHDRRPLDAEGLDRLLTNLERL